MFYLAEAVLLTKDLVFSKHSGVISAFGKHFAASGEIDSKLHRLLIEASKTRTTGDYDFMVDIDEEDTKEIIKMAREFQGGIISYLRDYLNGLF